MITRQISRTHVLYWCDLDGEGMIDAATDETLREAGYVPALDLAAASARATDAEKRASEAEARVVSAAQESSTLRSKLAEAESLAKRQDERASLAERCLTRYAALERAVRWTPPGDRSSAVQAALDALTPAAPAADSGTRRLSVVSEPRPAAGEVSR